MAEPPTPALSPEYRGEGARNNDRDSCSTQRLKRRHAKAPRPPRPRHPDGVEGDWQKNRKYHGGPDRAVCLYSEEQYAEIRAEGVNAGNGDFGENFTTRGLDLQALDVGSRLRVARIA
jgi:MOSC domain-containing protein YiiM